MLEVRIPKPEQRKPRRISIAAGGGEPQTIEGPRGLTRTAVSEGPLRRALCFPTAPVAPAFTIRTRDPGSRARTGTLALAHGEVRTPAFVPLATKAVVKTLEVSEAGDLGYDMVLSNTFHLFLAPGPELVERFGGVTASCAGTSR